MLYLHHTAQAGHKFAKQMIQVDRRDQHIAHIEQLAHLLRYGLALLPLQV